ncbi:MAG: hypothetical protein ACU841_05045 [Gammaproteobacteria bacterium]
MNDHTDSQAKTRLFIYLLLTFLIWITAGKCGTGDDTYWHIRVGEWVWANEKAPSTGIFSYTAAHFRWVSHEWLSALLIYAVFSLAGWPGLVFLATLSLTLAILLLFNFLVKRISVNASLIFILFAYFLVIPHIMPRPHILMLPLMVFWASRLIEASENEVQPPYPLALIMTLWSNMHGSFIMGIAFVPFFAAEGVFTTADPDKRTPLLKKWLLFFLLCLLAVFITPHGIDGLLLPFRLTDQSYTIDVISEWASPNFHGLQPLEFWLLAFIGLSLHKGLKLPAFRLVFLLGLLHLSLKYVRFATDLLPFLSPMILAVPFSRQLRRPPNFSMTTLYPKKTAHWLALGVYLTALAAYLPTRSIESEQSRQVGKVLTALEPEKAALGNVLNSYGISIHLIHYGYPVFIDSRAELYGDPFIKSYFKTIKLEKGAQPLLNLIRNYDISWIIFETKLPIVAYLGERPEWRPIYSDKYITLFLAADRDIGEETRQELRRIRDSLPEDEESEWEELPPF